MFTMADHSATKPDSRWKIKPIFLMNEIFLLNSRIVRRHFPVKHVLKTFQLSVSIFTQFCSRDFVLFLTRNRSSLHDKSLSCYTENAQGEQSDSKILQDLSLIL